MMSFTRIFFLMISCMVETLYSTEIPSFLNICHRNDPNLAQCLKKSIEAVGPYLEKGVPEYNIPSLEPLVMQDLICEEAAGMKITTTNVSAYGCTDFVVRDLKIDADNHVYKIFIDLPKLRILADYIVDGKLLLLPVRGNGNLEANVTDCVSVCILQGQLYEQDGETKIRFISGDLSVKVGGGHVQLENLFNGDKIILGMMNDVINKNFEPFIKELMPVIERALARTILEISNDIVESFTFDQLFPL